MEYKRYGYLNLANEDRHRRVPKRRKSEFANVLLFYVLPFIVVNALIFFAVTAQPKFEVTLGDTTDYATQEVQIKITSIFPKKEFTVTLDEEPVELTKLDNRLYSATLTHNGTLTVILTNINGMSKTTYEDISSIDDAPPIITQDEVATGYVSVYIEDTQAGVDFTSLYGVDTNGNVIEPSTIDETEGWAVFYFDTETIDIHVYDKAGKESIVTLGGSTVISNEELDPNGANAADSDATSGSSDNSNADSSDSSSESNTSGNDNGSSGSSDSSSDTAATQPSEQGFG